MIRIVKKAPAKKPVHTYSCPVQGVLGWRLGELWNEVEYTNEAEDSTLAHSVAIVGLSPIMREATENADDDDNIPFAATVSVVGASFVVNYWNGSDCPIEE